MNQEESSDSDNSSDKSEGAKQADEEQWATKALKKKNSVLVLQEQRTSALAAMATITEGRKSKMKNGIIVEESDSDDSFCTDSSGDSILSGSEDDDLNEEDRALQNQILLNFVANFKKGYSSQQ